MVVINLSPRIPRTHTYIYICIYVSLLNWTFNQETALICYSPKKMRSILPILLILSLSSIFLRARSLESKKKCIFTAKYDVFVFSNLPPNTPMLSAKCWSKDDDLGIHALAPGQNFNFHFCESFLGSLFTCYLSWKGKGKTFNVYNSRWIDLMCDRTRQCYWFAKEDGIYFSDENPPKKLEKHYDWLEHAWFDLFLGLSNI